MYLYIIISLAISFRIWIVETKISSYQGRVLIIEIEIWWIQKTFYDGCVGYILKG